MLRWRLPGVKGGEGVDVDFVDAVDIVDGMDGAVRRQAVHYVHSVHSVHVHCVREPALSQALPGAYRSGILYVTLFL